MSKGDVDEDAALEVVRQFATAVQTQAVTATITAFSKPSTWIVRAGGPVPRLVQAHMTQRYLRALDGRRQL